jgi:hypothetical protein
MGCRGMAAILPAMKNTRLSTSFLGLIVVLLAVLAAENFKSQSSVVLAAPAVRQQWEYKRISCDFKFTNHTYDGIDSWQEDGKDLPKPVDMDSKLAQLGAQGWELVSVTPYATWFEPISSGRASGSVVSTSGVTTFNMYIFRRPK